MKLLNLESTTRSLALISVTAGILMVTLSPVHGGIFGKNRPATAFSFAIFLANARSTDLVDVFQNLLLFIPFGFLIASCVPGGKRAIRPLVLACAAGLCLSGGVEILQAWIPGRFSSLLDVFLNGWGALLGGIMAVQIARMESKQTADPLRRIPQP